MYDAFVYMFVIGSGTTSGVAAVAFISYKIFMFMKKKEVVKNRKRTRGVV